MKVIEKQVGEIFPTLQGQKRISKLKVPTGEFGKSAEDKLLKTQIPEFFSGYKFPGKVVKPILLSFHHGHNVMVFGPTGSGKTMIFKMIASKLTLPLTRVNFDGDMGRPEIVGYLGIANDNDPDDDGYKMPALVRAIQRPGVLVLDEWDTARPEASIALQPLLEDHQPGLMLVERDEFVPKHPHCLIGATANTRGLGDEEGLYSGTQPQNYAQLNRFHLVMELPSPPPENIDKILKAQRYNGKPLSDNVRIALVKFYESVLAAYLAKQISAPLSIRGVLHLALYFQHLGPHAMELVLLQKMPTAKDREVIAGIAQRLKLAPKSTTGA